MSISVKVGDYVAVCPDKKTFIVYVNKTKGEKYSGSLANKLPYEELDLDFHADDIIANLGSKPKAGSIYGCAFDPFYKTMQSSFGDVHFFTKMEKKKAKALLEDIEGFYSNIKKKSLHKFLPLVIEIRPEKGSHDGHYTHYPRGDKTDLLCFRPADEVDNAFIFYHEYGHGIWHHLLDDRIRSKWVRAYYDCVNVISIDDIREHLNSVMSQYAYTISDYRAELKEKSEKESLKQILSYIKKVHALDLDDLDALRAANKSIVDYWPTKPLEKNEIVSNVSDYAKKNSREHFCECFAFYMCERALPKKLNTLMDKTLTKIAGRKSQISSE